MTEMPRKHLGALVPWANLAMEAELPYWISIKATWHFARLVPQSHTTAINEEFLRDMIDAIPEALAQLDQINLDLVAFGCTSASFSFSNRMSDLFSLGQMKAPFITAFTAIQSTLAHYNAQRILLLTPYEDQVTQKEISALQASGISVVESVSMGYVDKIGEIGTDEILEHFKRFSAIDADAIVISCTALHTRETINTLRQHYKIPIISSNSAIVMAAERTIKTSYNI